MRTIEPLRAGAAARHPDAWRPARRNPRLAGVAALVLALSLGPASLAGQEAPAGDSVTSAARRGGPSPRGAFLRSALVPGWGHASIGSFNRGAFYVAAEGATAFTLVKAWTRLREAEKRILFRERILRAELAAEGVTEVEEIQTRLDEDETLADLRSLEESRRQQREDWLALGIFLMLLSGADAYVSAHLSEFPAPIEIDGRSGGGSRMELFVRIPLPN